MTDNEKLIEEAAKALKPQFESAGLVDLDAEDYAWDAARAAFAIFEKAHAPADAPTVQFTARKGGKSQALIESMLAQANQRGIRVEVVHLDPTKEQVAAIAKHMAHAACDWGDVEVDGHEHTVECSNWTGYEDDARAALRAVGEVSR